MSTRDRVVQILMIVFFAYLFFLAIDLIGTGMKHSFKHPIQDFIANNAERFTELRSFVIGILGTALIQSSSSVTSMSVVMVQQSIIPLVIAAGIVHGANLGTSVTSSIVAFASEAPKLTGNPLRDGYNLLFEPRGPGFQRAVGTAVVHDFFNIIMITAILLLLELPFGFVLRTAEWVTRFLETGLQGSAAGVTSVLDWVSPSSYTGPIADGLLEVVTSEQVEGAVGLAQSDIGFAWILTLVGLPVLFVALRGFSGRMRTLIMSGVNVDEPEEVGRVLLGKSAFDTFLRGLVLTILVQSSSATTSMVVPLAAMGFFSVRKVFPFIMGANIGTTTTALLVATGSIGEPGFHDMMTIAMCHFLLNLLAVVLAATVPGLQASILGAAAWLAELAGVRPVALLAYLVMLVVVTPVIVYLFPQSIAALFMGFTMLFLLLAPQVYMRRRLAGDDPVG